MTKAERIARHRMVIDAIRDDIEWVRQNGFSIHPARYLGPCDSRAVVERLQGAQNLYQYFIEHLEGPSA